jgi:hypothetical protein
VDESAEYIVALDGLGSWRVAPVCAFRCEEGECPVRALAVVVGHVAGEHVFEVAAADDQQPVEALGSDGADEPFGIGVRLWRRIGVRITRIRSL